MSCIETYEYSTYFSATGQQSPFQLPRKICWNILCVSSPHPLVLCYSLVTLEWTPALMMKNTPICVWDFEEEIILSSSGWKWKKRCRKNQGLSSGMGNMYIVSASFLSPHVLHNLDNFLKLILCYSQNGDDSQEDLARFRYKQNMKLIFKKHLSILLAIYLNHV